MLNKNDFIKKIIEGFPQSFKNADIKAEKEKYNIGIEDNLDYDKLYELFIKNWRYKTAPPAAYFQDFFGQCRNPLQLINMPSERRTALIKVALWCNTEEHTKCLYEHKKAPWYVRELVNRYKFTPEEIDRLRVSGEIERD